MKTLKTLTVLLSMLCCTLTMKAQFLCGISQVYFYETMNPNQTFTFHDTTQLQQNWQIISWHWDFGDGGSSTIQNPQHHYSNNGVYTVCEIVTAGGNGAICSDTFCKQVTVACTSVTGNFTYVGGANGLVNFASSFTSSSTPISYVWNFGDGSGNTTAGANPSYTYIHPGFYTVCVYATDASGCTIQVCNQVGTTSGICGSLNANFTATTNGNVVALSSTSTGTNGNTLYQWWEDGQAITNPNPNTAFTLSNVANGTHTFCLALYANANTMCDSSCQSVTVGSSPCGNVQASFTATSNGGGVVVLQSTSTGAPANTMYEWWMDNAVIVQSNPNTAYTLSNVANGTHTFCLYVYAANTSTFCDSTCQSITITNGNPCSGLSAQWTQTYVQNNGVQFTSANSNSGAVYNWDFGDGHSSSQTSPTHYYANSGLYTVCLTVHIAGTICADTSCHNIQANAGTPCAGFGASITSQANPNGAGWYLTANEINGTPGANYYSAWSTGATTNSIFVTSGGSYCVTVTDTYGCSATACDSVGGNVTCNMVATITASNSGFYSILHAVSTGGVSPYVYYWSNGSSTSQDLTVTVSGTYCVTVYDNNQCSASACYTVQISNTCTDTICGTVFEDTNGNGVMDNGELPYTGGSVYISNSTQVFVDSFGHYSACVAAGNYNIYYCSQGSYTFTIPLGTPNPNGINNCAVYANVYVHGGGTHCGFDFGLQNNSSTICGMAYFDANNNHQLDSNETGIANVVVIITGGGASFTAYTDQSGHYCINVPAGTYTIHVQSNNYGNFLPTGISVTVANGQTYNHNDFGVYTQPGSCNLSINITPHTTVTAGYPAWYDLEVCNLGGNITSGTVSMFYDSHLTFTSASPVQTSQNSSTHTVSWALNNLTPGSCEYYWVNFDASPNTPVGQFIFTLANVITTGCNDIDMSNNVDTVHQDATASWDPNNKLAYVTNHEADPAYQEVSSLNADQRIEYVINFQNTGTAPAVNIVVNDILSNDLDASSFELLGASHDMTATRTGTELNFKFNAVMLPDATSDEPHSHGWVKFAVNAVNGLVPGHVISDDAAIYFDYNVPVITNDAAVTLLDVTGIDEVVANATIIVAPNPMSQSAEFRLNSATVTGFKLRVTDMTGRLVREETSTNNSMSFDRSNLAAGVYTYQVIQNNKLSAKGKLVVQ